MGDKPLEGEDGDRTGDQQTSFLRLELGDNSTGGSKEDMSQLLLLGKFEYGGGPIFKVVLEC